MIRNRLSTRQSSAVALALALSALLIVPACDDPKPDSAASGDATKPSEEHEKAPAAASGDPGQGEAEAEGTPKADGPTGSTGAEAKAAEGETQVEVSAEGSRFDRPVALSRIPTGAWACDMGGKVHYARGEKGDGKCEVCGMDLVSAGE